MPRLTIELRTAAREAARLYARRVGHAEALGYYDGITKAEDVIADWPGWEDAPYTEISDAAAEAIAEAFEDAP